MPLNVLVLFGQFLITKNGSNSSLQLYLIVILGGIQQLRGQEREEAKESTLVHPGGWGGYQDVHVDKGTEESWQITMKSFTFCSALT